MTRLVFKSAFEESGGKKRGKVIEVRPIIRHPDSITARSPIV